MADFFVLRVRCRRGSGDDSLGSVRHMQVYCNAAQMIRRRATGAYELAIGTAQELEEE